MSAPINDGGPAFPNYPTATNHKVINGANVCTHYGSSPGMSLRDWFAGQALAGILANQELCIRIDQEFSNLSTRSSVAIYAIACADAMLAAREKGAK